MGWVELKSRSDDDGWAYDDADPGEESMDEWGRSVHEGRRRR